MRWLTLGLCVSLAGCSSIFDEIDQQVIAAPQLPNVAASIKTVAAQYHLAQPLEFAGPIEAAPVSLVPWIVCLRSATAPKETYALFYKADAYVSSRISTIADRCDGQAYSSLPK
jgi:hypothetical protein